MVDLSIVYDQPSQVVSDDAGRLTVALATLSPATGGLPVFFDGWVGRPRLVAALLLSVGAVARARYFMPASARLLDPVLTSGDEMLRIEAFSSCCGVYARVDLLGDQLGEASIGAGTTNVDLGHEIRDGLGEAALAQVGMRPMAQLGAVGARRLLDALPPAGSASAPPYALAPTQSGFRFSQAPTSGAVCVAGPYRLSELRPLARFATGLRIWARPGDGARSCAFELTVPGARVWFVLSPDVTRGFSGEGTALDLLADASTVAEAVELRGHLGWRARLDEDELAEFADTSPARIRALLAVLGSQGLVGHDLAADAWFRRDLPFAEELIPKLAPRVGSAATITRADVEIRELPAGGHEVFVRSGNIEHRVVLDDDSVSCTCQWHTRHAGSRGPCRHVLAARAHISEAS
jgi:hypothetical protein